MIKRTVSKFTRVLKRVRTLLGPALPVLVTAILAGVLVTGVFYLFEWFWLAPKYNLPVPFTGGSSWTLRKPYFVFLVSSLLGLVGGVWYFVYRPNRERIAEAWGEVATWIQATLVGVASASLVAVGLAVLVIVSGVPVFVVPLGGALTWPVVTGLWIVVARRAVDTGSRRESLEVGYAQAKALESRMLAIVVGVFVGILGGVMTWQITARLLSGGSELATAVVAVLLCLVVTVLVYNRYEMRTEKLTDMSVVAVSESETRDRRTLTIRNDSSASIDLTHAKIRDTEFDLYRFGVPVTLGPGQLCTFEAPEAFRLAPNDDSRALPLGYTLKKGSERPAILTQTGELYALQRTDDRLTDGETPATESATMAGRDQVSSRSQQGSATEATPQD